MASFRCIFCNCAVRANCKGIVDSSPNAVATLAISTSISQRDILPKSSKVSVGPRVRKPDVLKCTSVGNLPTTKNPGPTV
ncbi:hypothetical protein WN943_021556 [Citrus x changshan-huyou]